MPSGRTYFHFLAGGIPVALFAHDMVSVHPLEDVANTVVDADAAPKYYDLATFFSKNAQPRYALQVRLRGTTAYITADTIFGMKSLESEQQYAVPHILKFGANMVLDTLIFNDEGRLIYYIIDPTRLESMYYKDTSCSYGMVFPECCNDACEYMYISNAGMHYALPTSCVCEVLTDFFIARMPAACGNVAGLMVYNKIMLPVFSSAPAARESELVLILENEGQYVGLCAEKIWDQMTAPATVREQCAYPDITQFHMTALPHEQL